jgi:hypothetical protein
VRICWPKRSVLKKVIRVGYGLVLQILSRHKGRWLNARDINKMTRGRVNKTTLYNSLKRVRKMAWVEKRRMAILLPNQGRKPVWHYRVV